jgi:hypothetical protein
MVSLGGRSRGNFLGKENNGLMIVEKGWALAQGN